MRERILLIDDEPYFRFAIELTLRKQGYLVSQLSDGGEALALLMAKQTPPPELVLLDLELSSFSATELMRRLRSGGIEAPIIAFSGYFNAQLYEELTGLGGVELLFKPVSEQLLLDTMIRLLHTAAPAATLFGG
jgi:DNA-binding response OmpR family regulator